MNKLEKTFRGKKILITGHTGFKGSWLSLWLNKLGANVVGVSKSIPTTPSNFEACGIRDLLIHREVELPNVKALKELIEEEKPDFIFHLAAQALVKESYLNPMTTMIHNAIGSASVLEALIGCEREITLIMITSDKVYDNLEWEWGYKETDLLGGKDPYSASKGMAELAIKSYFHSFFSQEDCPVRIGVARAGNVIGGGDWAKDRIVPDTMIATSKNQKVSIRSPSSTRPWQHVLEPLSGYLLLATRLSELKDFHGQSFNFGPKSELNYTVLDVLEELKRNWSSVDWDIEGETNLHEARLLKLSIDKALMKLSWLPVLNFQETIKFTADWYKAFYSNKMDMKEICEHQIEQYSNRSREVGQVWAADEY